MRSREEMFNFQEFTVDHIVSNPYCGAFLDMGCGKTVSTLTAIDRLMYQEVEVDRVLVVATKRVAESVWMQETQEWEHLQHIRVSRVIGTEQQRKAALKVDADVYVISCDNIQWLCAQYGGSALPFDMLIIDESSKFKNHKSKRFKAVRLLHFKRIVLLTGTPRPNGMGDLWSQLYLLDKGERLGRTIGEYRRLYFRPGQTNGHVVYNYKLNKGAEERIHKAIADICISMKAEDYLELPEMFPNPVMIEMPSALKKAYEQFERDKVLEIFGTGEEITPANAAALNNKLLQFANGAVYDSDRNVHVIHDLKLEALEEIMEEADGRPVLLAWTYKFDADRIEQRLAKYKPRRLKNDQDVKDWNAGKIKLLMMHPASGAHGLNFQYGGNIAVWFGQTWSLELYEQFNKRLHRPGQQNRVIINKLILRGTIDEDVIRAQEVKAEGQNALMQAVRARVRRHLKQR